MERLPADLQVEPGCRVRRIRDVRKEPATLRCVQVNGIITSEHSGDVAVSKPVKDDTYEPRTRVITRAGGNRRKRVVVMITKQGTGIDDRDG